ncbi:MAG: hypothetical protein A2X77_02615 [Gammaproteobacteria bacterium GWE2_42_36]|nr:MAG: hypothetical protein A2X77_02615 [Gammaproteobacteria bacterium GWE2_42_36]HCU05525.1 hypothetical protein [Coxiellaceae bacterium]
MSGQYSHLQFFRRMPTDFLSRYFAENDIDLGIDFKKLKTKKEQAILEAFLKLPEEQQAKIEAEFKDINAMACEGGAIALIDEAAFHGDESFAESIAAIDGFHGKAMWARLEKPEYWNGASMFLHADNVSVLSWKKRNDLPHAIADTSTSAINSLANAISAFFRSKEGRGRNCKVELYRRNNKHYFFAYPEDFGQSVVEWIKSSLVPQARHPAFEIIFVHCKDEGSLDIYAPKNTKAIPALQKIFAETILKIDTLQDAPIDQRVYDLSLLSDPTFEFKIARNSSIDDAVITQLRLTLKHNAKQRIVLEADTKKNPKAIYDLLKALNLPPYRITQVKIKVTFDAPAGKRAKTRTFSITHPNSCGLNHDGVDESIREMLIKSGLEPKAP